MEALLNLGNAPLRTFGTSIVVAMLLGVSAWIDVSQFGSVIDEHRSLVARGSRVMVVRSDAPLNAGQCDALGSLNGILHAGGIGITGVTELGHAPGARFRLAHATVGATFVLDPTQGKALRPAGWIIGSAAADELGIGTGSRIAVSGYPVAEVNRVVTGRSPELDRSLVWLVAPTGPTDECWVEFEPGAMSGGSDLLRYWFAGPDLVEVEPALALNEFSRDLAGEVAQRPQRHLWLAAAAILSLFLGVITWARRAEIGLYAAMGMDRQALQLLWSIDSLAVVGVGAAIGIAGVGIAMEVTATTATFESLKVALRGSAAAAVAAALVGSLWVHAVARTPIADLLKDR